MHPYTVMGNINQEWNIKRSNVGLISWKNVYIYFYDVLAGPIYLLRKAGTERKEDSSVDFEYSNLS